MGCATSNVLEDTVNISRMEGGIHPGLGGNVGKALEHGSHMSPGNEVRDGIAKLSDNNPFNDAAGRAEVQQGLQRMGEQHADGHHDHHGHNGHPEPHGGDRFPPNLSEHFPRLGNPKLL